MLIMQVILIPLCIAVFLINNQVEAFLLGEGLGSLAMFILGLGVE